MAQRVSNPFAGVKRPHPFARKAARRRDAEATALMVHVGHNARITYRRNVTRALVDRLG